jgi:hypothetical protein
MDPRGNPVKGACPASYVIAAERAGVNLILFSRCLCDSCVRIGQIDANTDAQSAMTDRRIVIAL